MNRARWQRIGEIFEAVSGLSGEALDRALAKHCGDDDELRREVASLLAADEEAESWLAGLTARANIPNREAEAILNEPGRQIGAWQLVRQIGRGGMGVVYLAERADEQFQMRAALKALPVGLVTREAVERFRREREILAGLEHPNIARLVDGGVTPEGTPYYVMEYVDGLPLDRYCRERKLSLDDRLRLFEQVAAAVVHAHRHLVIHRDVKPANILVTDAGEPRLLDFGVAKLLEDEAEPTRTATRLAQRRVTPAYTAPELMQGEPATTACDVYSLGVVLYQLLTDQQPFEPGFFDDAGWRDRLATYRPPLPSKAAGGAAGQRLKGDLDTIVAKAMHPDPARRYATVNALVADLERYRKQLPVTARPDTVGYRAARFVRRHAVGVALTGVAALALVAGTTVAIWQAREATLSAERAQRQTERALAAQHEAERARTRAVATRDFLVDLFDATIPDLPPDEMPDTESLLAAGADRVKAAQGMDPVVRADLLTAIGDIYRIRGRPDESRPVLERALELAHESRAAAPEVYARAVMAWTDLAAQEQGTGKTVARLEELVAFLKQRVPSDSIVLEARSELAWKLGMQQPERALEIMRAVNRDANGRDDVPERFRRKLKTRLAHMHFYNGQYADAAPLYEEAIEIEENLMGPEHRDVAIKLVNAAGNDSILGRFETANERFDRALRIHHDIGDAPSQTHAAAHANYGSSLAWEGRIERALEQQRKSIRIYAEHQGLESPDEYPFKDYRIAYVLSETALWTRARPYLENALRELSGREGYTLLRIQMLRGLAQERCIAGDAAGGRKYLQRLHEERGDRDLLPRLRAYIFEAEAHCHRAAGNPDAALQRLERAAELAPEVPPGAAAALSRRDLLRARLLAQTGDPGSAKRALAEARRTLADAGLENHPLMTGIRAFRERALAGDGP